MAMLMKAVSSRSGLMPLWATSPVTWTMPTGPAGTNGIVPSTMPMMPFLYRTSVSMVSVAPFGTARQSG